MNWKKIRDSVTCSKQMITVILEMRQQGYSQRQIGAVLNRHQSTICKYISHWKRYGADGFHDFDARHLRHGHVAVHSDFKAGLNCNRDRYLFAEKRNKRRYGAGDGCR